MSVKRCDTCRGSKIVMGLGGLEHKCKPCAGLGYAMKVDEKDEQDFLNAKSEPVIADKKTKVDKRSKEYKRARA